MQNDCLYRVEHLYLLEKRHTYDKKFSRNLLLCVERTLIYSELPAQDQTVLPRIILGITMSFTKVWMVVKLSSMKFSSRSTTSI